MVCAPFLYVLVARSKLDELKVHLLDVIFSLIATHCFCQMHDGKSCSRPIFPVLPLSTSLFGADALSSIHPLCSGMDGPGSTIRIEEKNHPCGRCWQHFRLST